jgi:hypothetical protein
MCCDGADDVREEGRDGRAACVPLVRLHLGTLIQRYSRLQTSCTKILLLP